MREVIEEMKNILSAVESTPWQTTSVSRDQLKRWIERLDHVERSSVGGWTTEDFMSEAADRGYDLPEQDAEDLLAELSDNFDASIGIRWQDLYDLLDKYEDENGIDPDEEEDPDGAEC